MVPLIWFRAIMPWMINIHNDFAIFGALLGTMLVVILTATLIIEFVFNIIKQPQSKD